MLTRLVACSTVFAGLMTGALWAQDDAVATSPVVVELFTSQGCSSCPSADALLAEMADNPDVIPLALHVDYWDYLGWKDVFAQRRFTKRQKSYARAAGTKTIYTPEMVLNGDTHVIGSHPDEVAQAIRVQSFKPQPVRMDVDRDGDSVQIFLEPTDEIAGMPAGVVQIVTYTPRQEVDVKRGENAGKTIAYTHIVQDWVALDPITAGVPEVHVTFELGTDLPFAVLYQAPDFGPILAAASLR